MILQNIWKKVVENVPIYISPSNIFRKLLSLEKYHKISQTVLGRRGGLGLILSNISSSNILSTMLGS